MADILVDTDGGLDDLLAIAAIAGAGRLWGVTTTWGNVSAMAAARNAALAAPDSDIWCGEASPPTTWRPNAAHGHDGVGDTLRGRRRLVRPRFDPGAAHVICRFARENPGGTVLCIGPLTNFARAIELDLAALTGLGSVVVLAGFGFAHPTVVRRIADTNTRHDPTAAVAVARAVGLPVRWVGLDVSRALVLRVADLPRTGIGDFGSMRAYGLRRHPAGIGHGWSAPCHDLVAAAAAMCPEIVAWRPAGVRVECSPTVHVAAGDAGTGAHLVACDIDIDHVRVHESRWAGLNFR